MSQQIQPSIKLDCSCLACNCKTCADYAGKKRFPNLGFNKCNHGTKPKCACENNNRSAKKKTPCLPCGLVEPEPIADSDWTQDMMSVLKHEPCDCTIVTRALRANIPRYLANNVQDP